MARIRTHYDNLKVSRDAPAAVIRAAYKTLTQQYHPDKNPADERAAKIMQLINASYEVLSDPARRQRHDEWIREQEAGEAGGNRPGPHRVVLPSHAQALVPRHRRCRCLRWDRARSRSCRRTASRPCAN